MACFCVFISRSGILVNEEERAKSHRAVDTMKMVTTEFDHMNKQFKCPPWLQVGYSFVTSY